MLYFGFKDLRSYLKDQGLISTREYLTRFENEGIISVSTHILALHKDEVEGQLMTKYMRIYAWDEIEKIAVQVRERKVVVDVNNRLTPVIFYTFKDLQESLKAAGLSSSRPMINAWEAAGILPLPENYLRFHKDNINISKKDIRLYTEQEIADRVIKVKDFLSSRPVSFIDR